MTFWESYRRTLIPMQLFIFVACAALYFFRSPPLIAVAVVFIVMQLGAVFGAAWGASLRRRRIERGEVLPLHRRR